MAKLKMDVDKIIQDGEELIIIANEFNNLIDNTYDKLIKVSENNVISSESENGVANVFIKTAEYDKKNLNNIGTNMYKLGEVIVNYGNDVKNTSNDTIGG